MEIWGLLKVKPSVQRLLVAYNTIRFTRFSPLQMVSNYVFQNCKVESHVICTIIKIGPDLKLYRYYAVCL